MSSCIDHSQVGTGLGYGSARYPALKVGGSVRMHRAEYCLANGLTLEDIAGLVVMHTCDNPRCINPEHLVLGTQRDNMLDMRNKGRAVGNVRYTKQQKDYAKSLVTQLGLSISEAARRSGVGRVTLSDYIKEGQING
ncbi:putative homing endonuclease [Klebsiella phage vB_KpP-Screen]|nr:putative homing endonuclease [Klebsiella phage vB_KpP-Screen]